jgi:methylated-DNA-[protein]-cysteine S-methyltransferase
VQSLTPQLATLARSPFGPVAVIWVARGDRPQVARVVLSRPGEPAGGRARTLVPHSRPGSCAEIDDALSAMAALLEGEAVEIPLDIADLASCPPFQQEVLRAEHAIPRGRVSTYRLIAAHLGRPRAARAVGNALATNPFPLIVPCHRAIRSDSHLGGYQGGIAMKRALLEMEGVAVDAVGRVDRPRLHYAQEPSSQAAPSRGTKRL